MFVSKFKEFILTMFFVVGVLTISTIFAGCASSGTKPPVEIVDVSGYPELQQGDTGEYVKILQEKIGVAVDGKFGSGTKNAVIQFQSSKGLVLQFPGTVGQKTWKALFGITDGVTPQPSPTPTPPPIEIPTGEAPALSWDNSTRKEWSKFVYGLIVGELWKEYSQATDGKRLCKNYDSLTKEQKAWVISEFWVQVMKKESAWVPTERYYEKTMGYYSEGLTMVSYPDQLWSPFCKFDKAADSKLSATDPRRTILDPYINMDCGMRIMGKQITEKKKFIFGPAQYWAVIKENGKYQKISEIVAGTQKLAVCQ